MNVNIEDFKTGWFGINVSLNSEDIDSLVEQLKRLKQQPNHHFHVYSTAFDIQASGVADIQFNYEPEYERESNMAIE